MGVKFGREYNDIIEDLTAAIHKINQVYEFFEMSQADWDALDQEEQKECIKTLADDVFYALGSQSSMEIAQGAAVYDKQKHVITVNQGNQIITIVKLV
jgi:hypothetical protein